MAIKCDFYLSIDPHIRIDELIVHRHTHTHTHPDVVGKTLLIREDKPKQLHRPNHIESCH